MILPFRRGEWKREDRLLLKWPEGTVLRCKEATGIRKLGTGGRGSLAPSWVKLSTDGCLPPWTGLEERVPRGPTVTVHPSALGFARVAPQYVDENRPNGGPQAPQVERARPELSTKVGRRVGRECAKACARPPGPARPGTLAHV